MPKSLRGVAGLETVGSLDANPGRSHGSMLIWDPGDQVNSPSPRMRSRGKE